MLSNTEHQAPAAGFTTDLLSSQQPACCVSAAAVATNSYRSLLSPWTIPADCQQDQQQQKLFPNITIQPCTHMTGADPTPQQQQVQLQEHSNEGVSPQPPVHEELMHDAAAEGTNSEPSSVLRQQQLQQQSLAQKRQRATSLLVMTQLLRLLMALCAGQHAPASAATAHALSRASLRAQLFKELRTAAAAAAATAGGSDDTAAAAEVLQHLPPARLRQICAAAQKRPVHLKGVFIRRASEAGAPAGAGSDSSSCGSDAGTSSSDTHTLHVVANCQTDPVANMGSAVHSPACAQHMGPSGDHQQQLQQHQQQQQQCLLVPQPQQQQQDRASAARAHSAPVNVMHPAAQPILWDVGCLLETTLVAAAAEAQLNSVDWEAPGSACLADDASSAVDIEGVMLEEIELAKLNGIL